MLSISTSLFSTAATWLLKLLSRRSGLSVDGTPPPNAGGDSVNVPAAGGETSGGVNMEAEVTIKDIIENRQEQLRDLE